MEENLDEVVAMVIVVVHLFARSVVAGNCTELSATDLHDASPPRHTPSSPVLLTSGSGSKLTCHRHLTETLLSK